MSTAILGLIGTPLADGEPLLRLPAEVRAGFALIPEHGPTSEDVLRRAELAHTMATTDAPTSRMPPDASVCRNVRSGSTTRLMTVRRVGIRGLSQASTFATRECRPSR